MNAITANTDIGEWSFVGVMPYDGLQRREVENSSQLIIIG
jgi:hypothetical protein